MAVVPDDGIVRIVAVDGAGAVDEAGGCALPPPPEDRTTATIAPATAATARPPRSRAFLTKPEATLAAGMSNQVEEQLKGLPAKPGVYLFRGDRGEVLYIGKAKSLRPRVRSYFQRSGETRAQIAQLPDRVADV